MHASPAIVVYTLSCVYILQDLRGFGHLSGREILLREVDNLITNKVNWYKTWAFLFVKIT